jgi:predicted nucleic acid-binding protein
LTSTTRARAEGKTISSADGYIAATAITHGLIVATRDTSPFEAAGLNVINPWNVPH